MKTLLLVLSIITCVKVEAKDLYFPVPTEKSAYLKILNKTSNPSYAFLQYRDQNHFLQEITFLIPAQSEKKINIKEIAPVSDWVLFKTENLMQTFFEIKDNDQWIEFSESVDLSKKVSLIQSSQKLKVLMANLSPLENKVVISNTMGNPNSIQTFMIPAYAAKEISLDSIPSGATMNFEASQRLRILAWTDTKEIPLKKIREKMQKDPEKRYFIFGTRTGPQFTVGLSDPTQIQKARDLIKKPGSMGSILSAQVSFGGNNHNFNLNSHPSWSWQVEQVFGFADLGSTECNGNAQSLEESAEEWIGSQKTICFWNSRPLREIEDFEQ